jgi:hypothetical protein
MTLPTILFGILLSSVYGAAYHLWRGGSVRRLTLFLVLAWAGFWAGDTLGWLLNWNFGSVGNLNAGMGTVGAALFLLAGDFISRIRLRE